MFLRYSYWIDWCKITQNINRCKYTNKRAKKMKFTSMFFAASAVLYSPSNGKYTNKRAR